MVINFPDERSGAPHLHVLIGEDYDLEAYALQLKEHFGGTTTTYIVKADDPPCIDCKFARGRVEAAKRSRRPGRDDWG